MIFGSPITIERGSFLYAYNSCTYIYYSSRYDYHSKVNDMPILNYTRGSKKSGTEIKAGNRKESQFVDHQFNLQQTFGNWKLKWEMNREAGVPFFLFRLEFLP